MYSVYAYVYTKTNLLKKDRLLFFVRNTKTRTKQKQIGYNISPILRVWIDNSSILRSAHIILGP